jgi:hypothetical protein
MAAARWLAVMLMSLGLAGCAAGGDGSEEADDLAVSDLGLEATATTGIIRGVVVDEAIRPLPGVRVTLVVEGETKQTESNDAGAFGFDSLPPGTYFLKAERFGFESIQQAAEVKAGDSQPRALPRPPPTCIPSP